MHSGIGKCIALELFKQGNVKIVINDIEPMREEAEKLVQEIRDAGGDAIAVTADCKLSSFPVRILLMTVALMYDLE